MTDTLLTTAELAARWKVAPESIRQQRFKGDGPPYFKLSRRGAVRYRLSDVIEFENSNMIRKQKE